MAFLIPSGVVTNLNEPLHVFIDQKDVEAAEEMTSMVQKLIPFFLLFFFGWDKSRGTADFI